MGNKILIVDDDPVVCHILSTLLQSSGYEVDVAKSGDECIQSIKAQYKSDSLPILIFLDFFLEDVSGLEVLADIRKILRDTHVPVIMLSAKTRDEMLDEFAEYSPDYYLQKPFKSEVVLSLIETAIKAKG
jgi:CheY-like chemotaxis protein